MRSASQLIVSPRHRHSTRIQGYDYRAVGWYFVTICAQNRECFFGEIQDRSVVLSEIGHAVATCWTGIPDHFPHVGLDAWILMPNHLHGILAIRPADHRPANEQASHEPSISRSLMNDWAFQPPASPPRLEVLPGSLGAIVRSFKSASTRKVNQLRGVLGLPLWQRNYYEHIIRNTDALNQIRQYIAENPAKWETDRENPNVQKAQHAAPLQRPPG